jgi:dipeptide/tripeptide permease
MVRRGAAEAQSARQGSLSDPTFRTILLGGLPVLMRESVLPLGGFVIGSAVAGLGAGIGLSAAVSVLVYLHERRSGRDALLIRLVLVFVAVQSVIGLVAHSAIAYLAQPVLFNAAWGLAFLGSAAVRRPLAGTLACAWYPFTAPYRATDEFKRVFGIESVVWGSYLVARSALRLTVLLTATVGSFVAVVVLTGAPVMLALVAWSIHYAIGHLPADIDEAPTPALTQVPAVTPKLAP